MHLCSQVRLMEMSSRAKKPRYACLSANLTAEFMH